MNYNTLPFRNLNLILMKVCDILYEFYCKKPASSKFNYIFQKKRESLKCKKKNNKKP